MDKRRFYVNVETGEISELKVGNNAQFTVYANPEEVKALRKCFEDKDHADYGTYWRAHVPFKEYHNDEDNDAVDHELLRAYKMIYQLGDEEAKEHISQFPFFESLMDSDDF
ncbi:hydrolase [Allobacillus sp. SKP2-8]|uniref:hydrolase n=1 Tax=unclassified Allobacillus TaxID=2628859 RepID=UPI0011822FCF|nr:hydrolase [Allobacillus sp. SKP2-8]TSJ65117.1 hydrolase [Allobacillus sp. SKP2-8]